MRSLMSTLASTAIPIVSARPAMPGSVSVPLNDARIASWMSRLKSTARVGDDAGLAVVEEHEEEHEAGAAERADGALLDRVLRRASGR